MPAVVFHLRPQMHRRSEVGACERVSEPGQTRPRYTQAVCAECTVRRSFSSSPT
jgi:hypothetical protein